MNQAINTCITGLNNIGQGFWDYAAGIFIQSSVLIILLLIIDFLLRKRVRAVFRYCLWMLVFIKLVMPASFTLPTGIGYWMGDYFPSEVSMAKWIPQTEEIVPTTLNIHQRSIPLEPIVMNETAVIDIYQGSIPLEPVITNETAVTGIELEHICWQGLVFLGWLVGMLTLLALLVQRICFVRGLIAQSRPANGRLLELLDECRCLIGIRRNIELRLSGNRLSPADCGLFKPIILMPTTLPEKLSREKLKAVLIHELAHIKRADVWVNLVQTMLQIVYFYNPFVWIANAMVHRVREQAVDEMVLVTLKPETKSYSNMLIDIAEMAFWRPNFSLHLIGVVESKKALERRIKHMLSRPVPKSSKLGYLGLIAIIVIGAILLPMGSNSIAEAANTQKNSREHSETKTIVPGLRVGDYTLGMSKDEVLKKLGEPEAIFWGGERYTLDNLPKRYFMSFGDISFEIYDDAVKGITAISPYYKFTNGLGVGDSEQKIKQAFGDDFHLKEFKGADHLTYEDEGLMFEIHKKNRTVMEINLYQPKRNQDDGTKALTPSRLEPFDNVCGKDLRTHDLRNAGRILDTLEFNQETLWPTPDRLPEGFDPNALLQEGMNPGLGIQALHAEGITGAGVHVGLIDQPLLLDHPEYAGKIVSYHDTGCGTSMSSMHGPGMASQLVGSRCGTAPGAKLHVVAVPSWKGDADYYARALDRLVTRNREVRKDQKIRVVSVSAQPSGEGSKYINQSLWDRAVQRAQANGILVLDCTWHHGFVSLCWLDPQDRESVKACTPGFRNGNVEVDKVHIHVPSAPRTVAEASAERPYGYAYDGGGRRSSRPMSKNGYSDTIPYAAGILAMGWQVRPDLTPAQIKEMLFTSAYVHKSGAKVINPTAFIDLVRNKNDNQRVQAPPQTDSETYTIVPGLRIGNYTLDMSKDDVLKELGEPEAIQLGKDDVDVVRPGEERYSLKNLPREHILSFGNISFWFSDDSIEAIGVRSPLYKLSNGLGVGDSEQKIKQAFGEDFLLAEVLGKDFLFYEAKGLGFEIHKKNQTVAEIVVYHQEGDRDTRHQQEQSERTKLVRQAVADGRISFKLTTPDEFKAIAGQPTKEWTYDDGEVIYMEYPGVQVKFFGKPEINIPHTVLYVMCEGMGIDIGQDRPIDEGDIDQQPGRSSSKDVSTLVRQAVADGRISFKLTTPDEFKAIAGQPTREWTEADDELIYMEYPDIQVSFFGKPEINTPHTLTSLRCEGRRIDIGRNRPIVLRNEGDLDKFGTFWGYSSVDLSRLDLSQKGELLKTMPFDSRTVWPEADRLPPDFDPKAVMEWGKYPGLGVKQLHEQGVTGKGVHVAIIDQPLLLGHIEYKDQLVSYKEIQTGNADPQMHGPPVASILVGKTCGVAPAAILHYWAEPSWKGDYKYRCIALEQIIQYNKEKTKSEQIRVVSVSKGFSPSEPNLDRWKTLLEKAKQSGIYIVHCGSMGLGAGCRFLKDSDNPANYRLCAFLQEGGFHGKPGIFFTPIDHRTTASHRARDAYTFWTRSGLSWGAPYYAGVVALGIQVNPDLRPDQIDKLLYDSGWDFQKGRLINPVGFVEAARSLSE